MEKTLNVRQQLKFDTLANWNDVSTAGKGGNLVLLKGEIAICQVPSNSTAIGGESSRPQYLMKVGDGATAFKSLPWVNAVAADVYAWAKAANRPTYKYGDSDLTGFGSAATKDDTYFDLAGAAAAAETAAKAYTDEQIEGISGTDTLYQLVITGTTLKLQSKERNDTEWTDVSGQSWNLNTILKGSIASGNTGFVIGGDVFTELGKKQDTLSFDGTYNATTNKAATVSTVTGAVEEEQERAEGVEAGLRTDVDAKVAAVTGEKAINVTTGTNPKVTLVIDTTNPGNVTLTQGTNGLKANIELPDVPVAGVKDGEKIVSLDDDDKIQTTLSLDYDSTNKKIQLKGISGAVVAELDATNFIKDGMVNTVTFNPSTKKLTITFNTDAGKEPIEIDMTSLVDTYTAGNGIDITSNVISVKKDSASEAFLSVGAGGVKLSGVQDAIDDAADTAQSNAQDYADGKIEDEVTRADAAYLGKNEKAADADKLDNHDSTYFATAEDVEAIETELGTFGDIVTHDVDEFDEAGAAATAEQNAKDYADGLNTAMDNRVDVLEAKPGLDKVGTVTSVGAGTGLKITGTATVNPTVEIDDTVTFILNGGSSTTVV